MLFIWVEIIVGLPCCQVILLLHHLVGEEEGEWLEGRVGEVILVVSVLLDTPD